MQALSRRVAGVSRTVLVENLIDAPGIADRLGLRQVQTVHSWVARYPDFPAPLCVLGRVRIWDWSEVKAWAESTGHPR
jgi:predicted DNA-binding transcriptional regulator AlpA